MSYRSDISVTSSTGSIGASQSGRIMEGANTMNNQSSSVSPPSPQGFPGIIYPSPQTESRIVTSILPPVPEAPGTNSPQYDVVTPLKSSLKGKSDVRRFSDTQVESMDLDDQQEIVVGGRKGRQHMLAVTVGGGGSGLDSPVQEMRPGYFSASGSVNTPASVATPVGGTFGGGSGSPTVREITAINPFEPRSGAITSPTVTNPVHRGSVSWAGSVELGPSSQVVPYHEVQSIGSIAASISHDQRPSFFSQTSGSPSGSGLSGPINYSGEEVSTLQLQPQEEKPLIPNRPLILVFSLLVLVGLLVSLGYHTVTTRILLTDSSESSSLFSSCHGRQTETQGYTIEDVTASLGGWDSVIESLRSECISDAELYLAMASSTSPANPSASTMEFSSTQQSPIPTAMWVTSSLSTKKTMIFSGSASANRVWTTSSSLRTSSDFWWVCSGSDGSFVVVNATVTNYPEYTVTAAFSAQAAWMASLAASSGGVGSSASVLCVDNQTVTLNLIAGTSAANYADTETVPFTMSATDLTAAVTVDSFSNFNSVGAEASLAKYSSLSSHHNGQSTFVFADPNFLYEIVAAVALVACCLLLVWQRREIDAVEREFVETLETADAVFKAGENLETVDLQGVPGFEHIRQPAKKTLEKTKTSSKRGRQQERDESTASTVAVVHMEPGKPITLKTRCCVDLRTQLHFTLTRLELYKSYLPKSIFVPGTMDDDEDVNLGDYAAAMSIYVGTPTPAPTPPSQPLRPLQPLHGGEVEAGSPDSIRDDPLGETWASTSQTNSIDKLRRTSSPPPISGQSTAGYHAFSSPNLGGMSPRSAAGPQATLERHSTMTSEMGSTFSGSPAEGGLSGRLIAPPSLAGFNPRRTSNLLDATITSLGGTLSGTQLGGTLSGTQLFRRPSFIAVMETRVDVSNFSLYRKKISCIVAKFFPADMMTTAVKGISRLGRLFHEVVEKSVAAFDGVLLRTELDQAIIVWNAFGPYPFHEARACNCAQHIMAHLHTLEEHPDVSALQPKWAVVVNTGGAVVGQCGTKRLSRPCALGDVLYFAEKVAELAPSIEAGVIVMEATHSIARQQVLCLPIDMVGSDQQRVTLFELKGQAGSAFGVRQKLYVEAFSLFCQCNFASATIKLQKCQGEGHARRLLRFCQLYAAQPDTQKYWRASPCWSLHEIDANQIHIPEDTLIMSGSLSKSGLGAAMSNSRRKSRKPSFLPELQLRNQLEAMQEARAAGRSPHRDAFLGDRSPAHQTNFLATLQEYQRGPSGSMNSTNSLEDQSPVDIKGTFVTNNAFGSGGSSMNNSGLGDVVTQDLMMKLSQNSQNSPTTALQGPWSPLNQRLKNPLTVENSPPQAALTSVSNSLASGQSSIHTNGSVTSSLVPQVTPQSPTLPGSPKRVTVVDSLREGSREALDRTDSGMSPTRDALDRTHTPKHLEAAVLEVAEMEPPLVLLQSGSESGSPKSPTITKENSTQESNDKAFLDGNGVRWMISEKVLGTGSFGTVQLGLSENGSLVALKFLPLPQDLFAEDGLALSQDETTKFAKQVEDVLGEVAMLSTLHNEHIVEYYSSAVLEDSLVVIMEYISGGSLTKLLNQFGALRTATIRCYCRDVLQGLRYLHSMGVIHRDINPNNVLVTTDGSCKLSDFGASSTLQKLVGVVDVYGTPAFMAPEACMGKAVPASDVWGFGVMVCQMYSGHLPYADEDVENVEKLIHRIALEDGFKPKVPYHKISDDAALNMILDCLNKDPSKRPTCEQLLLCPFII